MRDEIQTRGRDQHQPSGLHRAHHFLDLAEIVHEMLDHLRTPDHIEAPNVPIVIQIDIVKGDVDVRDVAIALLQPLGLEIDADIASDFFRMQRR